MIRVARLTWRLSWRSAAGWAAAMGLTCLMIVSTFQSAYPDTLSRAGLATSIGANPAFRALYGPAVGLDTPGGFLSWRIGSFAMMIFGVWALLVTSRVTRGDEEIGRSDLLAVGSLGGRQILTAQLAGIAAGTALQSGAVLAGCLAGGLALSGSALFAAGGAACGLFFAGVAAITSQLAITRRQAASWAAMVLGASYLLRVVGSVPEGGSWASWATPFGWVTMLSPFVSPEPATLLPFLVAVPVLVAAAIVIRSGRDLGAAVVDLPDRGRSPAPRPISTATLALRTGRGSALAWLIGVGVVTAVFGLLTIDLVKLVTENAGFSQLIARMLGIDLDSADSFLGLIFVMLAMVLAMLAGTQVGSMREDESTGRLDNLLVLPLSRARWLTTRVGVAALTILGVALFGALTGFAGAIWRGAEVTVGGALVAVANGLPVVALFGSISLVTLAIHPRATTTVGLGLPPLLYFFYMIGSIAKWPGWLLGISPFDHLAPAPALPVNSTATVVMLAISFALGASAIWRFTRRDLASE